MVIKEFNGKETALFGVLTQIKATENNPSHLFGIFQDIHFASLFYQ